MLSFDKACLSICWWDCAKLKFVQWPDRLLARQGKTQVCQQYWTSSRDCAYALHLAVTVGMRPTVPVKSAFASSCRHDNSIALSVPVSARLMQHAENTMHFIIMSKHAESHLCTAVQDCQILLVVSSSQADSMTAMRALSTSTCSGILAKRCINLRLTIISDLNPWVALGCRTRISFTQMSGQDGVLLATLMEFRVCRVGAA